jgi:hypothetical protein
MLKRVVCFIILLDIVCGKGSVSLDGLSFEKVINFIFTN